MPSRSVLVIRALLAGAALIAPSSPAFAFEAVDTVRSSSTGGFPAYEAQPIAPSEFWVQGGAMVDSNVIRRSSGSPTDEVFRLGAGGRKDTRIIGRQTLHLEGEVDGYLYNRNSDVDNLAYGATAEWLWELGNDLSGVLGVSRRRFQRDLAYLQAPIRDMITETHYVANGAYRLGPSFRLRAGADHVNTDVQLAAVNELNTTTGVVGLDYITGLGNTLGVEYRATRGDAPVPELIDPLALQVNNDFTEHTVAGTIGYLSPFFRVGGYLGRTKRTYSQIPGRDFEGTTWRGEADWTVTPKVILGFETHYEPRSVIDIAATHVVARGVSFGPRWAPTAKLAFSARVMRERREFSGDPGTVLAPGLFPIRLEIVRNIRLGAYWEYTRQLHWTFAIDHGSRESNVLERDYTYNAIIANVRYLFW
jgi:hypothetical protein